MKRISVLLTLVVCLVGAFGLVGCGEGSGKQQSNPFGGNQKPLFEAEIDSVFTCGNYDGTMLVINLKTKNNTDTSMPSILLSTYSSVTLDGNKLSEGYLSSDNPHAVSYTDSVGPNSEGITQLVYKLSKSEGTVDLKIKVDTLDYVNQVEILNEKIDLRSVEQITSESQYDVVVNKVTIADDGKGQDLIVLDVTFTNNSDKAASLGSAISMDLFQNDTALKSSYLPYNHPSHDESKSSNTYTDVKKGASIDAQVTFALQDTKNPVELTCCDSMSYDRAEILSKTIEVSGASGNQKVA